MDRLKAFLARNWLTILLAAAPPMLLWFFLQRETHGLLVRVDSDVPVISVDTQFSRGLEIRYNTIPITSLSVISVTVSNTGNQSIERSDFDTPLVLAFAGSLIPPVRLLRTDDSALRPNLFLSSTDSLTIEPLLLNGGDSFTFQVILTNRSRAAPAFVPLGRIKNIKTIRFEAAASQQRTAIWDVATSIASVIVALLSILMAVRIYREVRSFRSSIERAKASIPLSERLESRQGKGPISALAKRLNVEGHDAKSNLLVLRLRIEELLRNLARRSGLNERDQIGSINRLARTLEQRGIIPHDLASGISDISPAINRELHETASYLTGSDFHDLQRLALNVVAGLEAIEAPKHS